MRKKATAFFRTVFCGLLALCTVGLCACKKEDDTNCIHEFSWYLVEAPTCEEKGKTEGTCNKCGEKQYQYLEKLGHIFEEGVCSACGEREDANIVEVKNVNLGWSFEELFEQTVVLGELNASQINVLKSDIRYGQLKDLRVTKSGNITLTLSKNNKEYSATLPKSVREDFKMSGKAKGYVRSLYLDPLTQEIMVILADGTAEKHGLVTALLSSNSTHTEPTVDRILLNLQNELIFIYSNNIAKRVGSLSTETLSENDTPFIFEKNKNGDGYVLLNIFNWDTYSELIIPATHRGLPVKTVNTFYCRNYIIIPASVERVNTAVSTNIFTDAEEIPETWYLVAIGGKIYLKGEWEMVDGVPTPIE